MTTTWLRTQPWPCSADGFWKTGSAAWSGPGDPPGERGVELQPHAVAAVRPPLGQGTGGQVPPGRSRGVADAASAGPPEQHVKAGPQTYGAVKDTRHSRLLNLGTSAKHLNSSPPAAIYS